MVVGNTEVGIEMKFKHAVYPVLIGATHVPELNEIRVSLHGELPAAAVVKLLLGADMVCTMNLDQRRGRPRNL